MSYLYWNEPSPAFQEISTVKRMIQKPPATAELIYWATSIIFKQANGSNLGAAHFGLQAGKNFTNETKTAINLGGYNDTLPKLNPGTPQEISPTLRGTFPTIPNYGSNPNSPLFAWYPDRDYLFRVFLSPKQNWLDAELTDEPGNAGGDQTASEKAYRGTITDLSTGVETWIRDIIIPNAHLTEPMNDPSSWDEEFNTIGTIPWDIREYEMRVDNRLTTTATVVLQGTNTDLYVDKVGFRNTSTIPRVVANNAVLTLPGPAVRSSSKASLGSVAGSPNLVLATPADAVAGELLIAGIGCQFQTEVTPPSGWQALGTPVPASDGARLSLFTTRWDGAATTHTFTIPANSNNYAGVIVCMYKADPLATPRLGPAGTSAANGETIWNAPPVSKSGNYCRVLAFVTGMDQFNGNDRQFPADMREIVDTSTISAVGANNITAAGQEMLPSVNGSAGSKTASLGANGTWGWVARQVIVDPILQRAAPASDVSNTGWTVTPLWSKLDDALPDQSDWIIGGNSAVCVVGLGAITDPGFDEGHVLRYYVRRVDAASASLLVELLQGASTVLVSKTETILAGSSFVEGSLALTAAQAAAITDYTTLRLRLTATAA